MGKREIFFDGACLPVNPGGIACWGIVAVENGEVIKEKSGIVSRKGTNNIAEWTGLIEAMRLAKELGWKRVTILGDSQLVVNQFRGSWRINKQRLKKLYVMAAKEAVDLTVNVIWIRREKNLADSVCHRVFVEDIEKAARRRAEGQLKDYTIRKNGAGYLVGKDGQRAYRVLLDPPYCTCGFFQRYRSYPLLKRSDILIRCKHLFMVELCQKSAP